MITKSEYLKFVPRIFFKNGLPVQLIFFVTSKCNLRCRHCFYWKEVSRPDRNELSLEEIEKFTQNSKLNLLWLSLTGGEPFLRPDLAEIAASFCRNGRVINISVPTNGQLPKTIFATTKKILQFCPDTYVQVNVSLEGPEETHDHIRNCKGAYKKAIETFRQLKKLKNFPNFGLSVQTTLTSFNQNKIKDFYFFLRDRLKPDYFNFNLIRGKPQDPELKKVNIEYYEEMAKLFENDVKMGKWPYFNFLFSKLVLLKNFSVYREVSEIYKKNKCQNPCYALILSGVMNATGDIYPCEILENSRVGNIREVNYNLSNLWFSHQSEEIRKRISQKCFCTYECALSVNTLFNPSFYLKNLPNFFLT